MANTIRKWKRVCAVGCTHGELVNPAIRRQVLDFRRRFQPEIRFELGDLMDTTCFRAGAAGTKDESKSPRDDQAAALRWLREYEPTHIAWGNHEWRMYRLMEHPKAIVATLAAQMWNSLTDAAAKLHAKTVPYNLRHGWHYVGGVAFGHGYMFNEMALRDHAETLGCPVVMAHLHAPQMAEGRTIKDTPSYCVGGLVDEEKLDYGHLRRASLRHGHGVVFGEISDTEAHLWLARSENGKPLVFPPGL
jgi:hypothetical protein